VFFVFFLYLFLKCKSTKNRVSKVTENRYIYRDYIIDHLEIGNTVHLQKIIFIIFLFSSSFILSSAQEKSDSLEVVENPVLFADLLIGYSNAGKSAATFGVSVYYQSKNNLFTFRTSQTVSVDKIEWFYIFPTSIISNTTTEYAVLYGKRYIEDGIGYHFSTGISYNTNDAINGERLTSDAFLGVPISVGLNFFKEKKKKFRVLYGLIPVGEPTSFGRSIGFNLYANISKRTYVGLGLTFGLGWHKIYNDEK
jgi:hypothetical protein